MRGYQAQGTGLLRVHGGSVLQYALSVKLHTLSAYRWGEGAHIGKKMWPACGGMGGGHRQWLVV